MKKIATKFASKRFFLLIKSISILVAKRKKADVPYRMEVVDWVDPSNLLNLYTDFYAYIFQAN
jgi:hypothetical protein